tara:strand:+ start:4426 stop:5004 length:579 start_codon:yes stop_codon:yes gene_type:complete
MERAYSFSNMQLSLTTAEVPGHVVEGFAAGDDVIRIARLSDSISHHVSMNGKLHPIVSKNRSGVIEFDLINMSGTNKFLYDEMITCQTGAFAPVLVSISEVSTGEAIGGAIAGGVNSLFGTSFGNPLGGSGGFKLTEARGYITRPANMTKGAGLGITTWSIVVEDLIMETEESSNALSEALGSIGQLANIIL